MVIVSVVVPLIAVIILLLGNNCVESVIYCPTAIAPVMSVASTVAVVDNGVTTTSNVPLAVDNINVSPF